MRAQSSSVAGVHNFETGKDAYWGEASDTGIYYFRGRDLEVQHGNLVIGTSGKGIDFSATGDGSGSMGSELLDDYEEGTWTPVFRDNSSVGSALTTTNNSSTYTKIGRMVFVRGRVTRNDTNNYTNVLYVSGLPYPTHSNNVANNGGAWFDGTGTDDVTQIHWTSGASYFVFKKVGENNDYLRVNEYENARPVYFSGFYETT